MTVHIPQRRFIGLADRIKLGVFQNHGLLDPTHPHNPNGFNILGVIADRATACEMVRVVEPLQELERSGHNCFIMNAGYLIKRWKQGIDDFVGADLVLFNRLTAVQKDAETNVAILHTHEMGTAVVCDWDDDLSPEWLGGAPPDLSMFDAITVSTPWLKGVYAHKHTYVLPNAVQPERYEGEIREVPYLTVGLTGSQTHANDWKVAVGPIKRLLSEYPDLRCVVSGYMPPDLAGVEHVLTPRDIHPEFCVSDLTVPYPKYAWLLRQYDIGLAPVDPADKWTYSKSGLKVMEYKASARPVEVCGSVQTGAVVPIATGKPLPIYQDTIVNTVDGYLVPHREESYEMTMRYLIDSPVMRQKMARDAYESGKQFWQASAIEHRLRVYTWIIERARRKHQKAQQEAKA